MKYKEILENKEKEKAISIVNEIDRIFTLDLTWDDAIYSVCKLIEYPKNNAFIPDRVNENGRKVISRDLMDTIIKLRHLAVSK
jgi:plasmid rolling circle replication initiator protein Rep